MRTLKIEETAGRRESTVKKKAVKRVEEIEKRGGKKKARWRGELMLEKV